MVNKTILTIIIPTYNRVEELKISIPNFTKNKRNDIKFLILDDHSNDDTENFINECAFLDKRIQFVKNDKNLHINLNTYKGFQLVKSPYAMWLADDDIIVGDYIDDCINIFENNSNVSLIHNKVNNISESMSKLDFQIYQKGWEAIKNIFNQGASFPGLAYRMKNFDFNHYPLGKEKIYSLVKMNLIISKNYDIAILKSSGLKTLGGVFKKNIRDVILSQGRNGDYNIGERIGYAEEILNSKKVIELCYYLSPWSLNIAKQLDESNYEIFVNKISNSLGKYNVFFMFKMGIARFNNKIIFNILKIIFNFKGIQNIFYLSIFLIKKQLTKIYK